MRSTKERDSEIMDRLEACQRLRTAKRRAIRGEAHSAIVTVSDMLNKVSAHREMNASSCRQVKRK